MKVFIIISIILISFSTLIAQSDFLQNKVNNDTIFIKNNDSSYISIINYPKQTWLERNEGSIVGALMGALFAGLIAVLSVYLTSRANNKSRIQKEKEIYCGLLYSIKIELIFHDKNHNNLIEELKVIQHNSILANEIITDAPSRNISVSFLKELRSKIIDTELFNTTILLFISAYINKCELVNSDIKFERVIKISEKFKEQVDIPTSIKSYFDNQLIFVILVTIIYFIVGAIIGSFIHPEERLQTGIPVLPYQFNDRYKVL
ncbi:MAG: hypothetical protein IIA49_15760 [Bacteroidetes bacterium]|nr:hypothetical protein [Bacteroidota bacterium]